MLRPALLALLAISMLSTVPSMLRPAAGISSGSRIITYDISNEVSRSWTMAIDGPFIYLAGDSVLLSIIDTRLLESNSPNAITQVQAFPDSGCGNFVAAEGGLVVRNGVAWVSGNYNVGYALSRVNLNNLTVQTFQTCDNSSPILDGLAADANGTIYGGFESTYKGIARFDPKLKTWNTIAGALGTSHLIIDGTTIWFTTWPKGLGRVNINGTGLTMYSSGFDTYTSDLALGSDGGIWFTGNHTIGVFNPSDASVREFAYGSEDGPARLALDANQKLWVTGFWNRNIREFDPSTNSWNPNVGTSFPNGLPFSVGSDGGTIWGTVIDPMLLFHVNPGPIASFQYSPSPPIVGHFTVFDASASVSLYGPITNYQWHFSDGSTASGITLTHKFSNAGTYNASLTVTDVTGENDTVQEPIYVSDHDYLPGVSPGTTASYTLTVAYSNSSLALSADLKVTVTQVIGSNVTYGTGVFKQGIQTSSRLASIDVSREANPNLLPPFFTIASGLNVGEPIYPAGIYTAFQIGGSNSTRIAGVLRTVNLMSYNFGTTFFGGYWDRDTGIMGLLVASIAVNSTVETATYRLQSTNAWKNLATGFTASNTGIFQVGFISSTSGGQAPYSYQWDFGDGTTSTDTNPSHTFPSFGNYNVKLTVRDSAGNMNSYQQEVSAGIHNPLSSRSSSIVLFAKTFAMVLALVVLVGVVLTVSAVIVEERRRNRFAGLMR